MAFYLSSTVKAALCEPAFVISVSFYILKFALWYFFYFWYQVILLTFKEDNTGSSF